MLMNGMPISIFNALQNHVLEKAEGAFNRSAGAMVEQNGFKYRMYLDLSFDSKDLGRTYKCEVEKGGEIIDKSTITYYGGAKR